MKDNKWYDKKGDIAGMWIERDPMTICSHPFIQRHFPIGFTGVYVDVGAGHPILNSTSLYFRLMGWDVIAIEPIPHFIIEYIKYGFPALQYACSATDIGETDFQVCTNEDDGMGGSAFKVVFPDPKNGIVDIKVNAFTLNTIMEMERPDIQHIDVLDIDVEFYEYDVLCGFDFNKFSPKIIMVESWPFNPTRDQLYDIIVSNGYKLTDSAGANKIFLRNCAQVEYGG